VTFVLAIILAPLTLLTLCFAVELLAGIRPLPSKAMPMPGATSAVIIVPAHDEEAILSGRLTALRDAARGHARILLVADNCSDSTADIAKNVGVEVIERSDSVRRGKGFALDFAKQHLQADPPDVVLIIDADCTTDAESIGRLVACCAAAGTPCQATNLQAPLPGSSPAVRLSTFAFFIKNVIRQRALERLAGRAHLLGTGMALPWKIFDAAELATGNIVEDLKLGQDLAEAGHPPIFVEGATIWSDAETEGNTLSQRRRWEGGFLQNAFRSGPAMFSRSLRSGDLRGLWAAINIIIPPFAMLIMLDLAALAFGTTVTLLVGGQWWPITALTATVLLAGTGISLAWAAGGSRFVSLSDLARAPLYLAWKLPLYVGLVRDGAPKGWHRTHRGAA
jgi:cellulose synthase/poly-beta-1,6-N-acetylglucosamine synthase-like glycosyltransferase